MGERGVGSKEDLHDYLAFHLSNVADGLVGMPKHTVIVRDPDDPERWAVVSNEDDDVQRRLADVLYGSTNLSEARRVVAEQANDPSLWFFSHTAPEEYLQRALRRLHAAIEGEKRGDDRADIETGGDDE